MKIEIPAAVRVGIYWVTLVVAVAVPVAGAFGFIDADAVTRGAEIAATVLAVIAPVLALLNIKPDGIDEGE